MESRAGAIHTSSMTQQVYEDLRHQILDGDLAEGSRLPSEPESCRTYNVSRTTVREAYSMLQQEGIVEVRRGSGRYIVPGATTIMKGSANLIRSMRGFLTARGYTPSVHVVDVIERQATSDETAFFRHDGLVLEVSKAYTDGDDLLTYALNIFDQASVPDWEKIDWHTPMREIADGLGRSMRTSVVDVSAVELPRHIQERFGTEPTQPWLRTVGPAYDQRGRPLWWSNEYARGDVRTVRIVNREAQNSQ
ncbi:GntR family transcriptional regulator [Brachybacterium sacelli]|uniref:GntR family transcriptional regulator n=1 Tax=Brachybacterium sacelli TaxID=173364 RepID=A0ABS4WZF7_9MICO|nr:GntR family transcriptional regulator [Brachybacterium sacelli]MBP2381476.1 GntR family transcriptional regulator [Brachybacterium sacelli]